MNSGMMLKIIDAVVFIFVIYFGIHYYRTDHLIFDLLGLASAAYISLRKPDVNTLTLVFILLIANLIPAVVIYGHGQLGGYWLYSMLSIVNVVAVIAIWARTFILLRYGPSWLQKHASNINPNRQDTVMGLLFTFQALWQLLQFGEHLIRHRDDIGLGGLFGDWSPMLFYDMYKTGQFGFSVLTLLILYFLTFNGRVARQK
jgi:hypothetical protein